MRVYLKSGKTIRVSQKQAEEIVEMKKTVDQADLLLSRNRFSKTLDLMLDVKEVVAIK